MLCCTLHLAPVCLYALNKQLSMMLPIVKISLLHANPNQACVGTHSDHYLSLQVRLLMCYVITHPEKMDDAKQQQWQRLSHLTDMDMNGINNLELLGVPVKKRGASKGIGLTFGRKRKRAVRKASSGSSASFLSLAA